MIKPRAQSKPAAPAKVAARGLLAMVAAVAICGCTSGASDAVPVTISLQRETPNLAKATVLVDYSRSNAKIAQEQGHPSCAFILPGVAGEFADDGHGALIIKMHAQHGLRGPADIVACRMETGQPDVAPKELAARLDVKLTEAEDAAGKVIDLAALPVTLASRGDDAKSKRTTQGNPAESRKALEERTARPAPAAPTAPAAAAAAAGTAGASAPASSTAAPVAPAAPRAAPPAPRTPTPAPGRGAVLAPSAAQQRASANNNNPVAAGTGTGTSQDPTYDGSAGEDPKVPAYDVTVSTMPGGPTTLLGALQFEISYNGTSGGWVGIQGDAQCDALVDALRAINDTGARSIRVGLVSVQGMPTPAAMVRCSFRSRDYVAATNFTVQVVDASDTDSNPVQPLPSMRVSSVVRR